MPRWFRPAGHFFVPAGRGGGWPCVLACPPEALWASLGRFRGRGGTRIWVGS
nr:MAG TPA: hypothetical protein [Caudoviricetes sp.]